MGGSFEGRRCPVIKCNRWPSCRTAPRLNGAAATAAAAAQVQALQRLASCCRNITYRKPVSKQDLEERGEWMDAPDLVAAVEQQKHRAIECMHVSGGRGGRRGQPSGARQQ